MMVHHRVKKRKRAKLGEFKVIILRFGTLGVHGLVSSIGSNCGRKLKQGGGHFFCMTL